jgi:hypothetical protein
MGSQDGLPPRLGVARTCDGASHFRGSAFLIGRWPEMLKDFSKVSTASKRDEGDAALSRLAAVVCEKGGLGQDHRWP